MDGSKVVASTSVMSIPKQPDIHINLKKGLTKVIGLTCKKKGVCIGSITHYDSETGVAGITLNIDGLTMIYNLSKD